MRPTHLTLTALLVTTVLAGCGDPGSTTAGSAGSTSTPTASSARATPGTPAASAAATASGAATGPAPTSTPGEPFEVGPRAGDVLAAFGVAHDDTLALHSGPAKTFPVAATVPNLADDVTATGRGWRGDGGIWVEVRRGGVTGWANSRFLHWTGPSEDLTARVVDTMGGRPTAPTPAELGRRVAESLAGDEEGTLIVMSVPPSGTDPAKVTYDLLGVGDDSVSGWRLQVSTTLDGGTYRLGSVEATTFCSRGGSPTTRCA